MIQDISPKKYDNSYKPIAPSPDDYVCVFTGTNKKEDRILLKREHETLVFPKVQELKKAEIIQHTDELQFLFSIDDYNYFLLQAESTTTLDSYSFEKPTALRCCNPQDLCFAGMTAYHLYDWYRDNRFCGRCGHMMLHDHKERALVCPSCSNMIFPKISPAVIIGVKNGEYILLSRYAGREYKGRALLAGFCEIGETPEETVAREVMDEVGLKVKNITYYKSQPWGFASDLLLGFFADVDGSTDISLDTDELEKAVWVKRSDIEHDDNLLSLTATMIEEFRLGNII